MIKGYASEFSEISATLVQHPDLCQAVLQLVDVQPMPGKVTEGGDRLYQLRLILRQVFLSERDIANAYSETEIRLPRSQSIYASNNRVFASGWAERLVRTQYSRFYNQAIMEQLLAEGHTECFIPHSSEEDRNSKCSLYLAGKTHALRPLYDRLIASYVNGSWNSEELKIPEHPHCTHVITPIP